MLPPSCVGEVGGGVRGGVREGEGRGGEVVEGSTPKEGCEGKELQHLRTCCHPSQVLFAL